MINHGVSIDSSRGYMPKINENVCPHKNLYSNVYSCFINNSQKVVTTQMSINCLTDKYNVAFLYNGISFGQRKNEVQIHTMTEMNLENIVLSERSQSHHVL